MPADDVAKHSPLVGVDALDVPVAPQRLHQRTCRAPWRARDRQILHAVADAPQSRGMGRSTLLEYAVGDLDVAQVRSASDHLRLMAVVTQTRNLKPQAPLTFEQADGLESLDGIQSIAYGKTAPDIFNLDP
jgi:hypothetical protein